MFVRTKREKNVLNDEKLVPSYIISDIHYLQTEIVEKKREREIKKKRTKEESFFFFCFANFLFKFFITTPH